MWFYNFFRTGLGGMNYTSAPLSMKATLFKYSSGILDLPRGGSGLGSSIVVIAQQFHFQRTVRAWTTFGSSKVTYGHIVAFLASVGSLVTTIARFFIFCNICCRIEDTNIWMRWSLLQVMLMHPRLSFQQQTN